MVLPAIRRHETESLWDQPKQQQHWQDAQAWVQQPLQGFFTDDGNI